MTYAPATIRAVAAYWVARGGENLGIVGDAAHAARATYHNGLDRAIKRYGTSNMDVIASKDYSFRLARDRIGATNAASALDLGRLGGERQPMRDFSVWLVRECVARKPGTDDIREIIYSPDGKVVKRWDGASRVIRDGYPVATGQGDSSHLWHTHISYFRDAEARDKIIPFRAYFEEPEPDVIPLNVTSEVPVLIDVPKGTPFYDLDGQTMLLPSWGDDFIGRYSPFECGGFRAMYGTVAGVRRVGLTRFTAKRAVPDPSAELLDEIARLDQRIVSLNERRVDAITRLGGTPTAV